jgi:hypothetical protein
MRVTQTCSIKDIGDGQVLEGAHLLRLDGIEAVGTAKVGAGPSGAFVEAIARGLSSCLGIRPETAEVSRSQECKPRLGLLPVLWTPT